ncbi:hypothetical protein AAVH_09851 [Aphelenchoides avenae]|nr:hypothetical protein AAVH_09851 [Aphelenchus avenae]
MTNGSTIESFHKGDTLRLEEIMVIALGITSLRNSQHPMGGFTVDNDERFHMLEKSLMKIAAVTLYSTWERHFKDKFVVDGDTIFKLSTGADLHASKGKP